MLPSQFPDLSLFSGITRPDLYLFERGEEISCGSALLKVCKPRLGDELRNNPIQDAREAASKSSTGISPDELCAHLTQEFPMKRVIVALVLALSVVSVVGCGTGSPTKAPSGK